MENLRGGDQPGEFSEVKKHNSEEAMETPCFYY